MSLLPTTDTIGLDAVTGEPFYWRGWHDRERTLDGRSITLRLSNRGGENLTFEGEQIATICGRQRAPFKLIPRYVDLFLYRTSRGTFLCHRRWVSEAYGEIPVAFDHVEAGTLEAMRDALLNYDPTLNATTIWPEDSENARRSRRAKEWLRSSYAERVRKLMVLGEERCRRKP